MKIYVSLIFIVLSTNNIFISLVNSLECQYCSSTQYSSDCRKGTVTDLKTCTIQGEDHCYVEYIINTGSEPLYRRGCAPGNWCQQQVGNHGTALKFCNTCQGSQCNNEAIGSKDSSSVLCRKCEGEHPDSDCRKGTLNTSEECPIGSLCIEYYVATTRRNLWKRDCGDSNSCSKLQKQYLKSLEECKSCIYELCNNDEMKVVSR
ncbi:uncharacterized protein LOC123320953 [Coccinella septempunctata]|uniref:uncharacterized protein LOC123320953 n=1 Tax=Coccinella septempunctata TaxID=41139 RepID=UPI001D0611C3|nr:uncharacterized protein LOC123320953 [Coccinella septempunctata]